MERDVGSGGSAGAGTIGSSSLSEAVSAAGWMSSGSTGGTEMGAGCSGSKSDSSELSCSSSVCIKSGVVCAPLKSLMASCGFGVVRLWKGCHAGGAVAFNLKG